MSGGCGTLRPRLAAPSASCCLRCASAFAVPATTFFHSGATRARVKPRRSAPTRSGCGLTRVRLARLGSYVMAGRCAP
jgi:hypothetical protein